MRPRLIVIASHERPGKGLYEAKPSSFFTTVRPKSEHEDERRLVMQGMEEQAAGLRKELELQRVELIRVSYAASKAAVREVHGLKEEGTVPFAQYKDEVIPPPKLVQCHAFPAQECTL